MNHRSDVPGEVGVTAVKLEFSLVRTPIQKLQNHSDVNHCLQHEVPCRVQNSGENRSPSVLSAGQSGNSVIDQEQSPVDDSSLCSTSPICAAPLCRQFWKAGNYSDVSAPKSSHQSGSTYLHVHPKFLHSNATSHKWAFGAIAELLDNAIDEIRNGATFVVLDKTSNPRDGNPALLIQDDGGGMDPEAMRRCLSFGFSDKKSNSAIGQYGNGFKTSTMRLGGDVVVFSRSRNDRILTQSIGLLSYTFLVQAGYDRIVVPMVNYEFNRSTGSFDSLHFHSKEGGTSNLSLLLHWSPYSTENELLQQCNDIGPHGTKIIVYNLWHNDEGSMELDFESDPEDIWIAGGKFCSAQIDARNSVSKHHIANRLRYSLRAYLSVLYMRLPETFYMLLRGRVVEYHNVATELQFPEFILYKPHSSGSPMGQVITTIGFLKEAPHVNVHGFCIYHKNRLILPFWHVVKFSDSRGRGVVGVLEANFIQPTHNKQEFEKTSVFQKLENRLKEMTWEYWDFHCGLIGYQIKKKPRAPLPLQDSTTNFINQHGVHQPVLLRRNTSNVSCSKAAPVGGNVKFGATLSSRSSLQKPGDLVANIHRNPQEGINLRTNEQNQSEATGLLIQSATLTNLSESQEAVNVMLENKRLRELCSQYEKTEEELNLKVVRLRTELGEATRIYSHLLPEAQAIEKVKQEKNVQST